MTRLALLERLKEVQQMPRYQGRDITTISAALSNQALSRHIELCEQAAGAAPPPAKVGSNSASMRSAVLPSHRANLTDRRRWLGSVTWRN